MLFCTYRFSPQIRFNTSIEDIESQRLDGNMFEQRKKQSSLLAMSK